MNPQEGIGCPSAPLRRGPDGLEFEVQGIMLKVAPVSTKNLSLVNSSVRKISQRWLGNALPWQWRVLEWPLNQKGFGDTLVFQESTGRNTLVRSIGVIIVKLAHAIGRVLKGMESRSGRRATFRMGIAVLPASGSRAPTSVSQASHKAFTA
jgi:hypothetical protein